MIQKNKLDKTFGPVGSIAGIILFIAGIYTVVYSYAGIAIIALGAFVGFTGSYAYVDISKKKVRLSTNLFGFIPTGNWIPIEPTMNLEIKKSNYAWRAYSRSNRELNIDNNEFYIIITDFKKISIPLLKSDSLENARIKLTQLEHQLNITLPQQS